MTCPGSGVLRDCLAGKVRCRSCRRWVWGHYVGTSGLAWTSVHDR